MVPRRLSVLSFVLVIGISMLSSIAPALDQCSGLEPLSDQALLAAVGADPHKFQIGSLSCDQKQAIASNAINGGDSVGSLGCYAAHEAVVCWTCQPPVQTTEGILITYPNLTQPPGMKSGMSWSCGPANTGICELINSSWVCSGVHLTQTTCSDITEAWMQGY